MFLIKNCPACGKKIRFPFDRGKIKVTCVCGSSFIADPDDPVLYSGATFDIHSDAPQREPWGASVSAAIRRLKPRDITTRIINSALDVTYRLRNFRLLPAAEQLRIVIVAAAIALAAALLLYLIFHASPPPLPDEGIII